MPEPKVHPNSLGEILVAEGLLSEEQLTQARENQRITGKTLCRSLMDMGFITDERKNELLKEKFGFDIMPLRPEMVDLAVLKLVPKSEAMRHHLVPIRMDGDYLLVAMEEPQNVLVTDYLRTLTGHKIRAYAAKTEEILMALGRYPEADRRIDMATFSAPVRLAANFLLLVVYFVPGLVLLWLLLSGAEVADQFRTKITGVTTFEVALFLFLTWGTWGLIIFEIHGLIFRDSSASKSDEV